MNEDKDITIDNKFVQKVLEKNGLDYKVTFVSSGATEIAPDMKLIILDVSYKPKESFLKMVEHAKELNKDRESSDSPDSSVYRPGGRVMSWVKIGLKKGFKITLFKWKFLIVPLPKDSPEAETYNILIEADPDSRVVDGV